MPAALIDGLEVSYETRGSGQPLLILAGEPTGAYLGTVLRPKSWSH